MLTVAEIQAHPEFPHVFWALEPTKKGRTLVGQHRNCPAELAWELHGRGPKQLVLIMGLGAFKEAWQRQTRDFGHTHGDEYSVLIFDNRGIGESDKPMHRYSTSMMALDAYEVIHSIGWKKSRSVNVIGISMGGMIAQELAAVAPDMVASLLLVSTAPRVVNVVSWWENMLNRANLFMPKSVEAQIEMTKRNMFSKEFPGKEDATEAVVKRFPTNADRFAAGEIAKRRDAWRFSKIGFMCQAIAANWHCKTPEQLKELGDKVGRERIGIVHGTEDRMLVFKHAEMLLEELGGEEAGVSKWFYEGQGHVIPIEMRETFFDIVSTMCQKGVDENNKI